MKFVHLNSKKYVRFPNFWTMLSFLLMKAVGLFAFLKQKEGKNDTLLI